MLLIGLLKSPWAKGHIGELLVQLFAHWQLDKSIYRHLHNVTLNTPGGTIQIDHMFLSPFGIFVLETKNMSGCIFGGENMRNGRRRFTSTLTNSRASCGGTRCKSSLEIIRSALVGNYQPEHVFALSQALAMYDAYQMQLELCDQQIARSLNQLAQLRPVPGEPLPKPRTLSDSRTHSTSTSAPCSINWSASASRRSMVLALTWPCVWSPSAAPT